jgi:hypothetical protein
MKDIIVRSGECVQERPETAADRRFRCQSVPPSELCHLSRANQCRGSDRQLCRDERERLAGWFVPSPSVGTQARRLIVTVSNAAVVVALSRSWPLTHATPQRGAAADLISARGRRNAHHRPDHRPEARRYPPAPRFLAGRAERVWHPMASLALKRSTCNSNQFAGPLELVETSLSRPKPERQYYRSGRTGRAVVGGIGHIRSGPCGAPRNATRHVAGNWTGGHRSHHTQPARPFFIQRREP